MSSKRVVFITESKRDVSFRQTIDQNVVFTKASVSRILFPISVIPLSNWILASGSWDDLGVWDDFNVWID